MSYSNPMNYSLYKFNFNIKYYPSMSKFIKIIRFIISNQIDKIGENMTPFTH